MFLPILLTFFIICAHALENGLGKTPPMGWNTWNKFGCNINEKLIRETADLLISTGLARLGYIYVNLDDCWQMDRDPVTGRILEDKEKFPSGMAALSKYIHSRGLKFGLYSDAGTHTCEKRPGSLGYEDIDAQAYAEWEVDYLKYDNCYNQGLSHRMRYERMRDALNATGRPIYYSICNWGLDNVWTWGASVGNSWRVTGDIWDRFKTDGPLCSCKTTICRDGETGAECSVLNILDKIANVTEFAGPGGWNDPDMLELGNGHQSITEYRTHFSFWAALKAPLIMGHDMTKMTPAIFDILANEEVIAINQDALGESIRKLRLNESQGGVSNWEFWTGNLVDGKVVIIFNRSPFSNSRSVKWSDIVGGHEWCARDLWEKKNLGCAEDIEVKVEGWGVWMGKLKVPTQED